MKSSDVHFLQTYQFESSLWHLSRHTHSSLDPTMTQGHREIQVGNTYANIFHVIRLEIIVLKHTHIT